MAEISPNRSALKDFLASIATIRGDLSNITAPPFVLATHSTTELPQYWASSTQLFLAPASEPDPKLRALKVLKWFLGSLKAQQYAGRGERDGVKKPLNAFLGECFLGHWDGDGRTRLIAEQVSHHPPVTATILWNDECGIRAEGYTCQEITFSGSVNIKQIGHAILHIDKYDEDYLIPLPNVKVKGILSGILYPELVGSYLIVSTNGYVAEIDFSGKGFFSGGLKNSFEAKLYRETEPDQPVYTIKGQWVGSFTIHDVDAGNDLETFDSNAQRHTPITVANIDDQDPWETRRAWKGVSKALNAGNMQATSDEKGKVEQAQREMRKQEERDGTKWEQMFFKVVPKDDAFEQLAKKAGTALEIEKTKGIWKFDHSALEKRKPYHGGLTPNGGAADGRRDSRATGSTNDGVVAPTREHEPSQRDQDRPRSVTDDQASPSQESDGGQNEYRAVEEMLRDKYSSAKTR